MPAGDSASQSLVVGVGYTGSRLLNVLGKGIGLSRSGGASDARQYPLDLDRDEALGLVPAEHYQIVYTIPPTAGDVDARLQKLFGMLPAAPQRFVYLSTSGVYGDHGGAVVNEDAKTEPGNERARRRLCAEQQLTDWAAVTGSKLVILRVPGIYGPGRLGLDRIAAGIPVIDERDAHPGNRIHVDDLVRCCVAALDEQAPAGTYNVGDGDNRSSSWFAGEVARQAKLPPPPKIRRSAAETSFSDRRLSFLRESRILDLTKMRTQLGVKPSYADASKGIAASL